MKRERERGRGERREEGENRFSQRAMEKRREEKRRKEKREKNDC